MVPVLPAGETLPSLSVAGAALTMVRGEVLASPAMAVVLGVGASVSMPCATDRRAARDGRRRQQQQALAPGVLC